MVVVGGGGGWWWWVVVACVCECVCGAASQASRTHESLPRVSRLVHPVAAALHVSP